MSASSSPRTPVWLWGALVALFAAIVTVQVMAEDVTTRVATPSVSWIRSPELMRRLVLGYDALAADVYWIRSVQYYGDSKLSKDTKKNYDLLYPLLDMTTSLDPDFKIAYRFGAILLSEGYPSGPARPDQSIALLEKGIRRSPNRWEYYYDAGFVEYWWRQDYKAASDWLIKASKLPGAPEWLPPVAATFLAEGGRPAAARALWQEIASTAEEDWLRKTAQRGLKQVDAEEQIEQLSALATRFQQRVGRLPTGWQEFVQAGLLRGIPVDPSGTPYVYDSVSGAADVARESSLYPLRRRGQKPDARQ